jgi:hypothetical protein
VGLPHQLNMHAQIKTQTLPAAYEELPGLLTLKNFGPAVARPRHLTDGCSQPTMFAPTSCRSEAASLVQRRVKRGKRQSFQVRS